MRALPSVRARFMAAIAAGCMLCCPAAVSAAVTFVSVSAPTPGSSAVSSVTVATPSGLAADDVLIATISFRDGSPVGPTPSGWSVIATAGSGQRVTVVAYRRVVTTSEPASHTWNLSSSARAAGAIQAFRGVDTTNLIAASSTNYSSSNSSSLVASSVTPGIADTMLVGMWALASGSDSITTPASMAARFSVSTSAGPLGLALAGSTEAYAPATATGTRTATGSGSQQYGAILVALRPRPTPVGAWQFDEFQWNGTAGDVKDSSGNNFHGTSYGGVSTASATPAIPGATGTCRYGAFDGTDDHVEVPHNALLNGDTVLTYAAWIRPSSWSGINQVMAKSVHGGASAPAQMGLFGESGVFKGRAETVAGRYEVSTTLPAVNQWTHVALVYAGTSMTLYVNGNSAATTSFAGASLVQTADPITISKRFGSAQYFFAGAIDEVRVYRDALTQPQVGVVMAETRPCPQPAGLARFLLGHSSFGIHCRNEPISISALDAVGGLVGSYSGLVTLTTQSGRGSWSLVAGSGTLVDATLNDGFATYQFVPADGGQVTVALYYPEGATPIDVDVFQSNDSTLRDDDTEGLLAFAPSGFTVTGSLLSNPPPNPINDPVPTQLAGSNFAMHIAAYGQTDTDPLCGVIETYTGAKSLRFWMDHVNPNPGTLVATVNAIAVGSNEAGATAQNVTFSQGQASVTVKYKDVGQIRLQLKDPAALPQVIRGNSNAFVVKPASLTVSRIETLGGVANPGAATATGAAFVASAAPFRVEVEARDAESSITPSYGRETPAEGIRVASASLVVPAAGRNGTANDGVLAGATNFAVTATAGRFRNDTVAFDEMGIIRIAASVADGNYLGGGSVTGPLSGNVGRFYPASFAVMAGAAVTAACGSFTYMSQSNLGVSYTLESRGAGGVRTRNYDLGLLGAPAVANVSVVAENADGGINYGGRLLGVVNPWTQGAVTVATSAASFARGVAADGPFDNLRLGVTVSDPLGNTALTAMDLNATTVGNCVAAGNCSAVQLGSPTMVRYGRLMVKAALGPETSDLAVPLEAQYFDGSLYRTNTIDNCTTYRIAQAGLSAYTANLNAGETVLTSPVAATPLIGGGSDPSRPLLLSAPGIGNDGSVNLTLDVAPHLEFDWTGAGVSDPVGTAQFGRYRGHDRIIFWRER